jgi:branched-chain amino acid transport system substrate-binding protein
MQQHGDTVAGKKIEVILRDDAGVADTTRRLAQEAVVRDHVNALAGFGLTPLAMAVAPIATQAKVPMIVMAAATSVITAQSPFIVRSAQVIPQVGVGIADWAAQNGIKRVVTLVADYAPGFDAEKWFSERFKQGGGTVVESLRSPLANPDFAPFLQRAIDDKPDALFTFVPSGQGAALAKQFVERGMDKSGIKLIGTGDVTDDDQLNGMGDAVLGMITSGPYSAAHPGEVNKAFVAAFEKANPGMRPNFMAVFGYDGMNLVYQALTKDKGDADGTALVAAMKGMSWESPRGPVMIDPDTRDIVQNIYIRKVEQQNGALYNVEFATIPMMKDPAKAAAKP